MDWLKTRVLLVGLALGSALGVGTMILYDSLTRGMVVSPSECPLILAVDVLDTPQGWLYKVVGLKAEPRSLSQFNVTFFVFGSPVPGDEQPKVVHYDGPLTDLLDSYSDFAFYDRGAFDGKLDDGGDYFRAATWHNLHITRGGILVGGTVGCA